MKLSIFKIKFLKRIVKGFLGKKEESDSGVDFNADLIKKYVMNRTFAEIGCMWRVNGRYLFLAEEYGAKRVAAVDIYPASEEFLWQKKERNSDADSRNVLILNGKMVIERSA